MPEPPDVYLITEVAAAARVHARTIERGIACGEILAVRVGRNWRIPRAERDRLVGLKVTDSPKREPALLRPAGGAT